MIRTISKTNETRMVSRPEVLNMRDQFRYVINNRVVENNSRLPSTSSVESISVIDRGTIVELNNTTSSENRIGLMESIINYQNSSENGAILIQYSSPVVRTYLHNLLIRSANFSNISEEDLYRIGNIFLYTITNLDINELFLSDVIYNMRESMVIYNTNQVFSVLDAQVFSYNSYLHGVRLATETQLEERVQEFHQEVDHRITLNRRRVLYAGVGLVGSMALSSLGMPPVGGLLVRALTLNETVDSSTQSSVGEILRLKDVWAFSFKKMLDINQK